MTEKHSSGCLVVRKSLDHHLAERRIFNRQRVGDYYAHLIVALHNTHHSDDAAVPRVDWIDEWTPPRLIQSNKASEVQWTGNEADLYWTVDQVQITLPAEADAWAAGEALLRVSLAHSMPNLSRLLVRTVPDEPWRETAPELTWRLRPGKNQIMARGINAFGRESHLSRVLLRYQP